jgi:hypothetical protein
MPSRRWQTSDTYAALPLACWLHSVHENTMSTPPGHLDRFRVPAVLQLIALASLHRVPWYTPTKGTTDLRTYVAPETSVIYLTNLAQFVILAVVFNKGHPHR